MSSLVILLHVHNNIKNLIDLAKYLCKRAVMETRPKC